MVIPHALRGNVLWHKCVRHETIVQYGEGVEWLRSNGFRIYGVVIDGMNGLPQALKSLRLQMCQFHQMLIVRRFPTQDPEKEVSQELMELVNGITTTDKESFIGVLGEWYDKYRVWSTRGFMTGESSARYLRTCILDCASHT